MGTRETMDTREEEEGRKKAALALMPGVRALDERRGDEEVRFGQVADHLVDFAVNRPAFLDVIDAFGAYLAEVEQAEHDHDAPAGSAGG